MEERAFWLAWSQVNGIGPILLRRLQKHFGTLSEAWAADPTELLEVDGLGPQTIGLVVASRREIWPEELLLQHEQENPQFWTPADPEYPRLLLEIADPPAVLYYQGTVESGENAGTIPGVAIVGTRNPSDYGKIMTRRLTQILTQHGFTIVSGLAAGIDTEAHRSCLEAGGRTLAVLGTGVDVVYPWSNRGLYQQVQRQGLVLSEYPAGTKPDRTHFPRRNRIIAGLSRAVLVLEAPEKSGALITAYLANEYGRDVYALPGQVDNPRAIGCLRLLQKGAGVLIEPEELLESLGAMPSFASPGLDSSATPTTQLPLIPLDLPPDLSQVLQTLTNLAQEYHSEAVPLDLVVQRSQLPAGSVSAALLQLELQGLVSQLPGMRYARS